MTIKDEIEYHELCNDWRHRDQLIWATPSIVVTIGGILIGVAFGTINDLRIRAIVLFLAMIWSMVMTHALIKHHYFQEGSADKIKKISGEMLRKFSPHKRNPLEKVSAYLLILFSSSIVVIVITGLLLYTLYSIFML